MQNDVLMLIKYKLYKMGPSIDPWGIPEMISPG